MQNVRKLADEEKVRLYEKYKDTKLPNNRFCNILEYPYEELPEITFVMLAVLEEHEKHFRQLDDSHPMRGHGGTPHILDNSKGRSVYKQVKKLEKRMESCNKKIHQQKEKIKRHTHRLIKRQQAAHVTPGADNATELVARDLERHEKLQELMRTWNRVARKEQTRALLPALYTQIKEIDSTLIIDVANRDTIYIDQIDAWPHDTTVASKIARCYLTSNRSKIKRLRRKLKLCQKADEGKTQEHQDKQNPAIIAMQRDGVVTQWKKHPEIYFIKGYRKVAIRTYSEDASKISYPIKYAPNGEQKAEFEKMAVEKYGAVFAQQ